MVNYQNGKIYKIVCNENDMVYIGSTCKLLCQRLAQHRATYKAYQSGKYCFVTSFKLLEIGDCEIILLEKFPCNSREELNARERFYIETMNCVNKFIPTRTHKEYCDENKFKIMEYSKQYSKQYRKDHKEKHICDCGVEYICTNKSHHIKSQRHLKYQDLQHKIRKQIDKIKIESEHSDKLDEIFLTPIVLYALEPCQMNDLYMCSCGALCSLNSRFWHLKTRRHLEP